MEFNYDFLSNPRIFAVNRMDAHASLSFTNPSLSLCGEWRFFFAENKAALENTPSEWDTILVPGHIQLSGGGRYGVPQYVNSSYPWDGSEPLKSGELPSDNPIGCYEKTVFVPHDWERAFLRFDGVEPAFALYVNGKFVGYSEDSFTPAEFDITPFVCAGSENTIRVNVFRFTTASWLEDQDFWRFFGIFRAVTLFTTPKTHIFDAFVAAALSEDFASGEISAEIMLTGELSGSIIMRVAGEETRKHIDGSKVTLSLPVSSPKLWSAETPKLYNCAFELYDESGALLEKTSVNTGFRSFKAENGIMKLNGKRIIFNGVNRHEWSCRNGRAVSIEETRADIINMKQNNINAVRTCHYPNRVELYDLCDEYGIYVIDETNLETHGTWQIEGRVQVTEQTLPGDDEAWRGAVLDRAKSMLMRDRNHPSILIWSCGNESMGGLNIKAISDYFHAADASRLVHFEADGLEQIAPDSPFAHWRDLDISDVVSKMYWPAAKVEDYLKEHSDKPFILCEYAHSMGNSTGALKKYTDLLESCPCYQGGFIWDYIDQSLMLPAPNGTGFYPAYGGDFGDKPNDGSFCADGLVFYDRVNSPKMAEVKRCYQPFEFSMQPFALTVKNNTLYTELSDFITELTLAVNGNTVRRELFEYACAPGQTASMAMPELPQNIRGEATATARVLLKYDTAWAKAGHEIAFSQNSFGVYEPEKPNLDEAAPVSIINGDLSIGVRGENIRAFVSKYPAGLISLKSDSFDYILERPRPSFWRAPTENDRAWQMQYEYARWATVKYARPWLEDISVGANFARFTVSYSLPWTGEKDLELKTELCGDGSATFKLTWRGGECTVPEFGILFTLPVTLDSVEYYGMGPDECYCDREEGARLGLHRFSVKNNLTPYVTPEECGNRTGVRFAKLFGGGRALLFKSTSPSGMEFSALPYTPEQLESANHKYELPTPTKTIVRCNLMQMGVAGDNTWGARPHAEYYVHLKQGDEFSVTLEPVN